MKRTFVLLLALTIPAAAAGHPIPGQNYDRAITVTPTAHGLRIGYRLNVSSGIVIQTVARFLQDNPDIDASAIQGPEALFDVFTPRMGELIGDQLLVRIDGEEIPVTMLSHQHRDGLEHHLKCGYLYETDWKPTPGETHKLEFRELNFPDNPGEIVLTLVITDGIEVVEATYPDAELLGKPKIDRTAEDDDRLRGITATFRVKADAPPPPEEPESVFADEEPEQPQSLWQRLKTQGLPVLFDSGYGIGVLLLIAGIFGAAHALTPGHGKTMVAAYLVGERGTFMHAIILGVVVTITHTGAVIALAAILYAIYPDTVEAQVQQILGFVGGLLIGGLGLWLLLKRLAGQADHVHLMGGHSHSHSHDPDHKREMPGGWSGLIVLGISGGIVPCWDAVALLGIAITANRLWLGVPLLVAFSVGLALVLMALGMAVVFAKRAGGAKFGDSRWFRMLPIVSAVLLIGVGVWLCRDSLKIDVPDGEKPALKADMEG